ncbi:hypothetical protein AURDEDRAFT_173869 [Auricularia subglabra TFB-10046 SS5]|uniref:Serine-threonine/tyrosine-protein kinase catalytic domain-containing protein n=1 Tax=Auricularia subglabra (strain TFB-10046 / SS5) TaxID=717982 RepID=J0CZM7_AURST|nr:hypothetical protein AURDEDRAFT_173869 [Auricularia subglabra TFB-10046 SS5]
MCDGTPVSLVPAQADVSPWDAVSSTRTARRSSHFDDEWCEVVPWTDGGTRIDYLKGAPGRGSPGHRTYPPRAARRAADERAISPRLNAGSDVCDWNSVWMGADGTVHLSNFDVQPQRHPRSGFDDSYINAILRAIPYLAPCGVFAFGVLVYGLNVRRTPTVPMGDIYAACRDGVRPPRAEHAQLTDGIWAVVEKCWRAGPYRRPHMPSVLRQLRALQESRETPA